MEAIDRLYAIPIVERGVKVTQSVYQRIKLNRLFWGVQHIENVVNAAAVSVHPAVRALNGPISAVDRALCRSIDFVEQTVPAIYLPPELILANTKDYVLRPVLRRADSVKKMRDAVLDSPATAYAAHRLDDAIEAADQYMERFLPDSADCTQADASAASSPTDNRAVPSVDFDLTTHRNGTVDTVDAAGGAAAAATANDDDDDDPIPPAAMRTLRRGRRFSRKLTRRLTLRTIHEARALRHGGEEAVHIVTYALRLLVTDPRQACRRAAELWRYLSADEPDNQSRPQTLEQLLVLLLRESARRAVHVTNWVAQRATAVPRNFLLSATATAHFYMDSTLARVHIVKSAPSHLKHTLSDQYAWLGNLTSAQLERLAIFLAGRQAGQQ